MNLGFLCGQLPAADGNPVSGVSSLTELLQKAKRTLAVASMNILDFIPPPPCLRIFGQTNLYSSFIPIVWGSQKGRGGGNSQEYP